MLTAKTFRHLVILAACAGTLVTVPELALAQERSPEAMIAKADSNGDGNIEWTEVTTLRSQTFQRMDRNGDGIVNSKDAPERMAGRFNTALSKLQADYDVDRDGEITEAEMLEAPSPFFDAGDADGDGVLTADEMTALRASKSPQ